MIIVGGPDPRALTSGHWVVLRMIDGPDPACVTHLDHFERLRIAEHRILASQLFCDLHDSGTYPKQLSALDTGERLFFMQGGLADRLVTEVQSWVERDRTFRARTLAYPALQAGFFLKAQLGLVRVLDKRP